MFLILKRFASRLPAPIQQELKRWYFYRMIVSKKFDPSEPESSILEKYVKSGDWVIDIGANVGHYTLILSEIVGINGRVIAVEPVPESFYILTANSSLFKYNNVTLINAAISESNSYVGIEIPESKSGLNNYYKAHISNETCCNLKVWCTSIDSLSFPCKISLVKIDAEGQEFKILKGMKNLITDDKPTLIVEGKDPKIRKWLKGYSYNALNLPRSPNTIFENFQKRN